MRSTRPPVGVSQPPMVRPAEARPPVRVANESVFRPWDYVVFIVLTIAASAAVAYALLHWFSPVNWMDAPVLFVALTVPLLVSLAMYGSRWLALPLMRKPRPMPARDGLRVGVATTFVPGAEPIEMLERTLTALVAMEYPHETWVLDEGDDAAVKALCDRLGARHFSRRGIARYQQDAGPFAARTKHGNYNAWLDAVGYERYDYLAAFDPDHVPNREFLTRLLGYFDDLGVGYVQAAQIYYNQPASFIARGAAEETYAYYSSIQMSSYAIGYPIVTGCHNVHRVAALRAIGGFAAHDADDLLITIHYRVSGWRGVYVPEALARGLTPVDWPNYLRQQRRWARSVLDVKLRCFPKLARGLPLPERAFSLAHGLYYLHGVSSAITVALVAFMLASGKTPAVLSTATASKMVVLLVALQLCDLYRQRFFLERRSEWGLHWRAALLRLAKWPHVLAAAWDALFSRPKPYAVTRKVRSRARPRLVGPPHLAVATLLIGAAGVGAMRGVEAHPVLLGCAAALVVLSVSLTVTEHRRFPPPYDPRLAQERLVQCNDWESSVAPLSRPGTVNLEASVVH